MLATIKVFSSISAVSRNPDRPTSTNITATEQPQRNALAHWITYPLRWRKSLKCLGISLGCGAAVADAGACA
jgi:hypothetical protein